MGATMARAIIARAVFVKSVGRIEVLATRLAFAAVACELHLEIQYFATLRPERVVNIALSI
jgi:hypothetical protein